MTLASFLFKGEWPTDGEVHAGNASVCHELTWSSVARARNVSVVDELWNIYFEGTNAALRGHELCDCFRGRLKQGPFRLTENRFFRLRVPHGQPLKPGEHTRKEYLQLSFLTQVGNHSALMGGHMLPDDFEIMKKNLRCQAGRCNARHAWKAPLLETAERLLSPLKATDIVYNTGHWAPHAAPRDFFPQLFRALTRSLAHASIGSDGGAGSAGSGTTRAWWRTSTPVVRNLKPLGLRTQLASGALDGIPVLGGGDALHRPTLDAARSEGWSVLDLYSVISRLLYPSIKRGEHAWKKPTTYYVSPRWPGYTMDDVHLMCSVNREANILLLNMLCDPRDL